MHETALPMIPPLNRMVLGFYEQNYNGHRIISHGGDTEYFHSDLSLFLDDHVGLYVSMNSAGRARQAAGRLLRQLAPHRHLVHEHPEPHPADSCDDRQRQYGEPGRAAEH